MEQPLQIQTAESATTALGMGDLAASSEPASSTRRWWTRHGRLTGAVAGSIVVISSALLLLDDPAQRRGAALAGLCLVLWLSEVVPPFVPTLVLWAVTPLLLASEGTAFEPARVLTWSVDPVLALFFGGFALGAAAQQHGLDAWLAEQLVRWSRGRRALLVALLMGGTAALSMWMSNVAAAAMMIAAVRPVLRSLEAQDPFRRAVLVGIAMGGNFGGLATPIGTGPNGIAIAAVQAHRPITFLSWMAFGVPLALGLLLAVFLILRQRYDLAGAFERPRAPPVRLLPTGRWLIGVGLLAIGGWLTEPWHHVSAATIAMMLAVILFAGRWLGRDDLRRIDWSTLILIAGGIALGRLLENIGLVKTIAEHLPFGEMSLFARLLLFVSAAALLAALMSNTGTATMLIPLALQLDPEPSTAVLVAVATSLGAPFIVSTPPNAMVCGEGGVTARDLLIPGLLVMAFGCLLVAGTGPLVLRLFGF